MVLVPVQCPKCKKEEVSKHGKDEKLGLALKLLKRKRPMEEIVEDTGLSREEIESLL